MNLIERRVKYHCDWFPNQSLETELPGKLCLPSNCVCPRIETEFLGQGHSQTEFGNEAEGFENLVGLVSYSSFFWGVQMNIPQYLSNILIGLSFTPTLLSVLLALRLFFSRLLSTPKQWRNATRKRQHLIRAVGVLIFIQAIIVGLLLYLNSAEPSSLLTILIILVLGAVSGWYMSNSLRMFSQGAIRFDHHYKIKGNGSIWPELFSKNSDGKTISSRRKKIDQISALQCPNPKCGDSRLIISPAVAAIYDGQRLTWPLLYMKPFWESVSSNGVILSLLVVLASAIWWSSLTVKIILTLTLLTDGLLLLIYLTHYASAKKVSTLFYYCSWCNYAWAEYISSVDRMTAWAEGELARQDKRAKEKELALALAQAGMMALYAQDDQRAVTLSETCLSLAAGEDKHLAFAKAYRNLGLVALYQGNYHQAMANFEKSLTLSRKIRDWQGIAHALNHLGLTALYQGNHAQAELAFRKSLPMHQKMGNKWGLAWGLMGLAGVAQKQGQPIHSARLYGAGQICRNTARLALSLQRCPGFNRSVTAVQAELGETVYQTAWLAGYESDTINQAVAYALTTQPAVVV